MVLMDKASRFKRKVTKFIYLSCLAVIIIALIMELTTCIKFIGESQVIQTSACRSELLNGAAYAVGPGYIGLFIIIATSLFYLEVGP
jgi:hypothetical protein